MTYREQIAVLTAALRDVDERALLIRAIHTRWVRGGDTCDAMDSANDHAIAIHETIAEALRKAT